jgi:Tol biopolymer transport system component
LTTADGQSRRITTDIRDDEPSVSIDGTMVVFIRKIKEEHEAFGTFITESEIWWASCAENWRPARLVKPPIESAYQAFRHPQLSPDSSKVYFLVDQWNATTGGLFYVERANGSVGFFAPALRFWIVPKGSLRGDLILEQAPLSLSEGRLDIYYLFSPEGKQVQIVGLKEESVKSFLNEAEYY